MCHRDRVKDWKWSKCLTVLWNVYKPVIHGEWGLVALSKPWGLSRWGPLVIPALHSSPPKEGWWRCRWAGGRPEEATASWWQQPGWHKAGGSPCVGRVGSAGGSRRMRTSTRSLLQRRRLQSHINTYFKEYVRGYFWPVCGVR